MYKNAQHNIGQNSQFVVRVNFLLLSFGIAWTNIYNEFFYLFNCAHFSALWGPDFKKVILFLNAMWPSPCDSFWSWMEGEFELMYNSSCQVIFSCISYEVS